MYSSFSYPFFIILTIILIVSIICSVIVYYTFISTNDSTTFIESFIFDFNIKKYSLSSSFCWPVPGYTKITSPFGSRIAPTFRCFYISHWH
jgi:hypothetical protein